MRTLLVDENTLHIVSMSLTQAELLERRVFLVDRLDRADRITPSSSPLMDCVIFIRPSDGSVDAACAEVQKAHYKSYSVVFCSATCPDHLDRLAYADSKCRVERVLEVFCDFCVVNDDAFFVESPPPSVFQPSMRARRLAEGLSSLMAASQCTPIVRYQASSELATQVADELSDVLRHEELFGHKQQDTVLLIVDRMWDPLTPLMTPWTYQAMLHEYIGIDHNVVKLPAAVSSPESGGAGEPDGPQQLVVSSKDDPLFEANMVSQWGEVCVNLKKAVDRCKDVMPSDRVSATLEDLSALMQSVPENRAMTFRATKHVSLATHMSDVIKRSCLLEVALLEQHMYAAANRDDHWTRLVALSNRVGIAPHHILRLCIIYNLRYEKPSEVSRAQSIVEKLRLNDDAYGSIKDVRTRFGGKATERLFTESSLMQSMLRTLSSEEQTENVYAQYKPALKSLLQDVATGKLSESVFRTIAGSKKQQSSTARIRRVWVFFCGGYTYAEAAFVRDVNMGRVKWNCPSEVSVGPLACLIGGDSIVNSHEFLDSVHSQGN